MANGTKHSIRKKVNGDAFVNVETGETLASQEGIDVYVHTAPTSVPVHYPEYTTFSDQALHWLLTNLKKSDVPKVFQMATTVRNDCNMLMQQNFHPYTPETLSEFIGISLNEMYIVLRRLEKQNVLACTRTYRDGYKKYVYTMNPYITKHNRSINCEVLAIFRDITKE